MGTLIDPVSATSIEDSRDRQVVDRPHDRQGYCCAGDVRAAAQRRRGEQLGRAGRRLRRFFSAKYASSEDDWTDADDVTSHVASGYTGAPKGFWASDRRVGKSKPL